MPISRRVPLIRKLLLFDACTPHLERCHTDKTCLSNPNIFCVHRFGMDTDVLYTNNQYIGFLRFSDLQILLHLLYHIAEYKEYSRLSPECLFFIVTKDLKFLKAVASEWSSLKKKCKDLKKIELSGDSISVSFRFRELEYNVDIKIISLPTQNLSSRDSIKELIAKLQP